MLRIVEEATNVGFQSLSVSLVIIVLIILLIIVLPNLYWMYGDDDDYDTMEWDKETRAWVPIKPLEPPTICVFYSPGMKESIDKILKKPEEGLIKQAKSLEVSDSTDINQQNDQNPLKLT